MKEMNVVIIGLTITSSWGNGHATTYRSLLKALNRRGHKITFLEHDKSWYAQNRDMLKADFAKIELYSSVEELKKVYLRTVSDADVVIVGSYVPEGVEVGKWVQQNAQGITAFYDIDTPVTLSKLEKGDYEYLHPDLIPAFDLYLSFTGGPTLDLLENKYGSPAARSLYCSVDTEIYSMKESAIEFDLGYLGTYSKDRQEPLQKLMVNAAAQWPEGNFIIAGPSYPVDIPWPANVKRIQHIPPEDHCTFYNSQRFTMNVTRSDMIEAGYAPSVRLFEAAACGVPIISDFWEGLDSIFEFDKEILVAYCEQDTLRYLTQISEEERIQIGLNAREKVLKYHTSDKRAEELESYLKEVKVPQPI